MVWRIFGVMAGFFWTYSANVNLAMLTVDGATYATVQSAFNRHVRHALFFALFFGIGLAIAAHKFAVETNPLIDKVLHSLPLAQCGGCGYPGFFANFARCGFDEAFAFFLAACDRLPVAGMQCALEQ